MTNTDQQLAQMLDRPEFPRSTKYALRWILENQMGLNALWLTEWLCQVLDLRSGMRVLDLGCGKALSSIFLAKEFGVQVWATDLWIGATENRKRIEQAEVTDQVFPIHAEARTLPYAEEFFDALICVDAYIYFGTDDLYLNYFQRFVKPDGPIAIVVPGFMQPVEGPLPEHLIPFWAQECWTWHTVDWWVKLWQRTGLVRVDVADTLPDGCKLWVQWKRARVTVGEESPALKSDIDVLEEDGGRYMGFIRMVARRNHQTES